MEDRFRMVRTWSWFFVSFSLVSLLFVAGCGSVDDQAAQKLKPNNLNQTKQLTRKQDAFLQRARDVIREIEPLRSKSSWPGVVKSIGRARMNRSASVFAVLTLEWERTGDDTYVQARRLLEQSEVLENQRQGLLKEWTDAMADARSSIPADQYSPKQLKAVVGNTELYYEMNKSALNRFALDESGFLIQVVQPGKVG